MNDYNQTYHQIIHYYSIWNDYAFLIPIICVAIVTFIIFWCCICPVYRCLKCLWCCRSKHTYQRVDDDRCWLNHLNKSRIKSSTSFFDFSRCHFATHKQQKKWCYDGKHNKNDPKWILNTSNACYGYVCMISWRVDHSHTTRE